MRGQKEVKKRGIGGAGAGGGGVGVGGAGGGGGENRWRWTMVVALSLFSAIGWGRTVPIAVPSDQGYGDTESSITIPFSGWDEQTRFFRIAFEVGSRNEELGITNADFCVQVALGQKRTDFNDLLPEDTDIIFGYDCGEWFVREEGQGQGSRSTVEECAHHTTPTPLTYTFDISQRFDRAWNTAKITTRGTSIPAATIAAEFKNNPMRIIIR